MRSRRSDAALAMQVALDFLAQDCPAQAIAACDLAMCQPQIAERAAFELAKDLIGRGRYGTAVTVLEVATKALKVSAATLRPRLDRVHGCNTPRLRSEVPFEFENHHLAQRSVQ